MIGSGAVGNSEILIAGGGPAGAVMAIRLARLGHAVCLAESAAVPRRHVGVSLAPACVHILAELNVGEELQELVAQRPEGTILHWGGKTQLKDYASPSGGVHVDRGHFDRLLMAEAEHAGAQLLRPARVAAARRLPNGGWEATIVTEERRYTWRAGILVAAGGRQSPLLGKRQRLSPATIALYGFWRDVPLDNHFGRVEAGEHHWCWAAPLPDGTVCAAVFLDPASPRLRADEGASGAYLETLASSRLLSSCCSGTLIGPVEVCSAARSATSPAAGQDFICVGDACFAIDPLSAQGVLQAMVSALQGATVVNTIRRRSNSSDTALAFYAARQKEAVERDRAWGMAYYREQALATATAFWTNRAEGPADRPEARPAAAQRFPLPQDVPLQLSKAASIRSVPVARGDYVELAPALNHPTLERPIAYVNDVPIERLACALQKAPILSDLMEEWRHHLPAPGAARLIQKLWTHGIIADGSAAMDETSSWGELP